MFLHEAGKTGNRRMQFEEFLHRARQEFVDKRSKRANLFRPPGEIVQCEPVG